MAKQVVMGAMLKCSFGLTPSSLIVIPKGTPHIVENKLAANIMDHIPITNILPFGMCNTPTNPAVASATAAAMGVLTPMPCVPVIPAPWIPGSPTVTINNFLALNDTSKCMCTWGGVITITYPGQTLVSIP
ncbi:MAG: DUF4280 domain-containing protein [Gomphosphaeria aponina SAG 52.96 = DSM 107014]|uniref:DUF4280 domain-containing protein n=1 Tax=Gomphosphaeria aponina SAG 52.96 = DSM 107014 TaxID=1521640 RepID=A0A941GWQ8_9CHRO|nr:DUF4280 domain-containing protein [Gomphosphaeria aponina SAG 52.96 = DSM 107014]